MINIAILGYGVVGSGVAEVIHKNDKSIAQRAGKRIQVAKILDIRDFSDDPYAHLITKDAEDIFQDSSIQIVAETIGGTGAAYAFTKRAFQAGKHVVSSNKELVATHGPELLKMAQECQVNYLFEASVGGGIPIIRPLNQCLAANELDEIIGILNGTTNYILTRMRKDGVDFNTALKEAQQKGYAELNPAADVEGHDSCRKIAILSSIAFNEFVDYNNIETEGITHISTMDMHYAEAMQAAIKLIAMSRRVDGKIYARVAPTLVSKEHSLAGVEDVFNAIVVQGDAVGETMFYGRGAGKLPTASAVVADIIDIVKHPDSKGRHIWEIRKDNMGDAGSLAASRFIRIRTSDKQSAIQAIQQVFGKVDWVVVNHPDAEGELGFIASPQSQHSINDKIIVLQSMQPDIQILAMLYML